MGTTIEFFDDDDDDDDDESRMMTVRRKQTLEKVTYEFSAKFYIADEILVEQVHLTSL